MYARLLARAPPRTLVASNDRNQASYETQQSITSVTDDKNDGNNDAARNGYIPYNWWPNGQKGSLPGGTTKHICKDAHR